MISQNNNTNLLVITSYPPKGETHGTGTVGVASYAKNTLLSLVKAAKKQKSRLNIVVLAEKLNGDNNDSYNENGIRIFRVWKRGSAFVYFQLLAGIIKFWQIKTILIEFELSMFGRYLSLIFLPVLLFLLKLAGKEIVIVSHQAVDDINLMSGHIGMEKDSIKMHIINLFINLFYKTVFASVSKIIVFEEYLKDKLSKFAQRNKIIVIPHGVENFKSVPAKETARKKLGIKTDEFMILYFGFIAWYKGTDWLVEKIKIVESGNKKVKLIIAGGPNPNHADKKYYMDYIRIIRRATENTKGKITVTGFVDEDKIPLYFAACDAVVLPYRVLMSSSGPLSLALSFEKPFLISEDMAGIIKTKDISQTMIDNKVSINDFCFSLTDGSFEKKFKKISSNKEYLSKLSGFSKELKSKRDFDNIGNMYLKELFT